MQENDQWVTIMAKRGTKALLESKGRKGENWDQLVRRVTVNSLSDEAVRALAPFAVVGESIDDTVQRLVEKLAPAPRAK